jgi:hypothetical protein
MKKFRPLIGRDANRRFCFDVEFLYVANLHGLRLQEIPIRWNHDERNESQRFSR